MIERGQRHSHSNIAIKIGKKLLFQLHIDLESTSDFPGIQTRPNCIVIIKYDVYVSHFVVGEILK